MSNPRSPTTSSQTSAAAAMPYTTATLSPAVQSLFSRNENHVKDFHPPPTIAEYAHLLATTAKQDLPPRILIITCCDPRVNAHAIFNLSSGEAIIVATAGGDIAPAVPGILAIDAAAPISDVVVMRHTDCGTSKWTDEGVREKLRERVGGEGSGAVGRAKDVRGRHGEGLEEMTFCESVGGESEADESKLREDVAWLRSSKLFRDGMRGRVVGCVYETHCGKVRVVC